MTTTDLYMGVDPGNSGAIAVIDFVARPIGFVKLDGTEREVAHFVAHCRENVKFALLEVARAMTKPRPNSIICPTCRKMTPTQGVTSMFTFGQSYGFVRALLIGYAIEFATVQPVQWQTRLNCLTGGNKSVSKAAAQCKFPDAKITHANADAYLLAFLARQQHHEFENLPF